MSSGVSASLIAAIYLHAGKDECIEVFIPPLQALNDFDQMYTDPAEEVSIFVDKVPRSHRWVSARNLRRTGNSIATALELRLSCTNLSH